MAPGSDATSRRRLRAERLGLTTIVLIGLTIWLQRLDVNDHGIMLANELIFSREPLATLLFHMRWDDQSPLYFVVMHGWMQLFGESPAAIRLMNVPVMMAVVVVVHQIARRAHGSPRVSLTAALLAATSPMSLWMVRDGRMYPALLLLAALTVLLLLRYGEGRQQRDLLGLGICSVLGIYNHFLGFGIAAIAMAVLFVDLLVEARARGCSRGRALERSLGPPLLVSLGVGLAVLPQIVRLLGLLGEAPKAADWSMAGLSIAYMRELGAFLFVKTSWGDLRRYIPFADRLYGFSLYALYALGVATSPRRLQWLNLLWVVLPVLALGLMAIELDLRSRYCAFMAPLLWVGIAWGGLGSRTRRPRRPDAQRALRIMRSLLLAVVLLTSWALLAQKVPERNHQWTKLMQGLDRLYRPGMHVYMPAGNSTGMPQTAASHQGLQAGLSDVRPLSPSQRANFLRQRQRGEEFVVLQRADRVNHEATRWHRWLVAAGYHVTRLSTLGARAEVFTLAPVREFSRLHRLPPRPAEQEILGFARQRLRDAERPVEPGVELGEYLLMRFHRDGLVEESVFFMSQKGERGTWRLSARDDDALEQAEGLSGGERASALRVRLEPDSTLVVARRGSRCAAGLLV
ncbi:MAG: glycosyltransferase family 39 protein, partial [Actinomycetota bacterium]|nr:glycosyltransferase family 39 protein [Actinomycetota bacterium]